MRRREFIGLLGGAAAWPLAARAQQPAMPVIGYLGNMSPPDKNLMGAFLSGLSDRGYVEGKNVAIEYRATEGRYDRLPMLAAELVARRVDVIVATGPPIALAAKAATTTIPIVFGVGVDPVKMGLVASFNRPGGNVTGHTSITLDLAAKRLQLLREVVPNAAVIALLVNPTNPFVGLETSDVQDAARSLGVELHVVTASSESDLAPAFATLIRERGDALVMSADPFLFSRTTQLAGLAARHRVPAMSAYRDYVAAGGLMSYGANIVAHLREVGVYTGRILAGEKPGDLPVQQATKVDLVINLKTAKALGLNVPATLLARADEVIE
jgi:putative ABC transport system substrate-binding protein